MKRLCILLIFISLAVSMNSQNKTYRWDLRVGICGYPVNYYGNRDYFQFTNSYDYYYKNRGSIFTSYKKDAIMIGAVSISTSYKLVKYIAMGINLSYLPIFVKTSYLISQNRNKNIVDNIFSFRPFVRIFYYTKDALDVYCSGGIGLSVGIINRISKDYPYKIYNKNNYYPELQLVPIGFRYGKKTFIFTELGLGTEFTGIKLGIGKRF